VRRLSDVEHRAVAKVATRISEISIGVSERSTSISIDVETVG